jgi:hypothetical protein
VLADVEHHDDVLMDQPPDRRFAQEALADFVFFHVVAQDFDRHEAADVGVAPQIEESHLAGAEPLQNLIPVDGPRERRRWHVAADSR